MQALGCVLSLTGGWARSFDTADAGEYPDAKRRRSAEAVPRGLTREGGRRVRSFDM